MPQDSDFANFYISFIVLFNINTSPSNNSSLTTFQQISLDQPGRDDLSWGQLENFYGSAK